MNVREMVRVWKRSKKERVEIENMLRKAGRKQLLRDLREGKL
jgi:hypothetical protein